jgi:hypothetical protein
VKRQHEPQRIVGDLLAAEIAEKQARSDAAGARHQGGPYRASTSTG